VAGLPEIAGENAAPATDSKNTAGRPTTVGRVIGTADADEGGGGPDLEEGTAIEFEIETAPKGPRATNVVRNRRASSSRIFYCSHDGEP